MHLLRLRVESGIHSQSTNHTSQSELCVCLGVERGGVVLVQLQPPSWMLDAEPCLSLQAALSSSWWPFLLENSLWRQVKPWQSALMMRDSKFKRQLRCGLLLKSVKFDEVKFEIQNDTKFSPPMVFEHFQIHAVHPPGPAHSPVSHLSGP